MSQRASSPVSSLDVHRLGVPAEGDQLQGIPAEPRTDQRVQGERGALHRHPPAVHGHREDGVDEQRHRRLRACLGLGDLHVVDVEAYAAARVAAVGHHALHGVGDGAGDVPGLGVAELPGPRRAGALTGGAGLAQVALALAAGHPRGHVAQQRLAELAHRLGASLSWPSLDRLR